MFARVEKKSLNPVDKHVGGRVRMRRLMLAMSQEKLGDALGLSFQQVQKYEKGTNRIGASRLQQISHILQVPVAFFFESAPNLHRSTDRIKDAPSPSYVSDFLATPEGLLLTKAFMRINEPKLRRRIVDLVEQIAGGPSHGAVKMTGDVEHVEHPVPASIVGAILDEVIGPDMIALLGP